MKECLIYRDSTRRKVFFYLKGEIKLRVVNGFLSFIFILINRDYTRKKVLVHFKGEICIF